VPIPDDGLLGWPLSFVVAISDERKREIRDEKVERGCGL